MKTLKEGDEAPEIKAKDHNGNEVNLQNFNGKKLILYFYPKDDTPGCTKESCNLRDHYAMLRSKGFEILGVSVDDEKSHQKFIKKYNLPFSLISDIDKKVVNDYGVWGEKTFMGITRMGTHRKTFVIDENGIIVKIFDKVETGNHAEQILEALQMS